jgi:hypothetical protein
MESPTFDPHAKIVSDNRSGRIKKKQNLDKNLTQLDSKSALGGRAGL